MKFKNIKMKFECDIYLASILFIVLNNMQKKLKMKAIFI